MKNNQETPDINKYEQLHRHDGTKTYRIDLLFEKDHSPYEVYLENQLSELIVTMTLEHLEKEYTSHHTKKISRFGELIGDGPAFEILKDGSMLGWKTSSNWIINGDTTKHEFIDPLKSYEHKNAEDWLIKFKKLYSEASYVYIEMSDYYFKVVDKWYFVEAFHKADELGLNKDKHISEVFPPKEDRDVRMIELQDLCPEFMVPPTKRDTSLMKMVHYTSEQFEKVDYGITSYGYSAGWWYLDIKMPGMETIKIKRFASYKGPAVQLYRVPEEYGGRKDILFIIQEPNDMHQEQVGGMYVIRPRVIE